MVYICHLCCPSQQHAKNLYYDENKDDQIAKANGHAKQKLLLETELAEIERGDCMALSGYAQARVNQYAKSSRSNLAAWDKIVQDPVRFTEWLDANIENHVSRGEHADQWKANLSAAALQCWKHCHGDPTEYKKWHEALMTATCRNPNWVINRSGNWYKVRDLKRLDPTVAFILVAGWEYRLIGWLLDLGAQLNDIGVDDMTPSELSVGTDDMLAVPQIEYTKPSGRPAEYHPDHAFNVNSKSMAAALACLGVSVSALRGRRVLGETKCMAAGYVCARQRHQ